MEESLVRHLHFLGIMILSSMLMLENILISKELKAGQVRKLFIIDGLYGFGAALTFIAGFLLWQCVGKPKDFYSSNFLFHTKVSIFFVIALMSILLTVFLIKNRGRNTSTIRLPTHIIVIKRLELMLLVCLPLLATLIAKGIGIGI